MGVLTVENIVSGYADKIVIDGVSFFADKGEFVGVIGPNGAGKSTLLKTMSRSIHPKKGDVLFEGKDIFKLPRKEFARSIAFVGQDTAVTFAFTALEIALMGRFPYLRAFQSESEKDLSAVRRALRITDCEDFLDRDINQLSAGERQRIFIAKALAQEPRLILLDEPTSHLDISHQIQIMDILKDLSEKDGICVVSVFHDLNLASEYCDKLLLVKDGRIYAQGRPSEVLRYEILEDVYKTVVIVQENPFSKKPYILLAPRAGRALARR
ncbi:MAG: ABC transporter ATP-binding protein [Candidatus Omnitrophota bacterium]